MTAAHGTGRFAYLGRSPEEVATRLGVVIDATDTEVYFVDPYTMKFVYANAAATAHMGYSMDELLELGPREIEPDWDATQVVPGVMQLLNGTRSELVCSGAHQRKDGTTYPVELHLFCSELNGEVVIVALAQDTSIPLEAERRLAKSRERLDLVLQATRMAIWDWDVENGSLVLDSPLETVDTLPPGVPLPDSIWPTLTHPDDWARQTRHWRAHFAGHLEMYQCDWRIKCADGSYRWIRSRGRVVDWSADHRPLRVVGCYLDIHEEKEKELAYADSEADLTAVIESSADAVVVFDEAYRVLRWNEAARRAVAAIHGIELNESTSVLEFVRPGDEDATARMMERVRDGASSTFEGDVNWAGASRHFEFSVSPVPDKQGRVRHFSLIARDLTERRKLEATRNQASKLESLGLLAGGVAHDFANLLGALSNNIELAALVAEDEDALKQSLDDALSAARKASELVQQLLAYCGQGPTRSTPVDASRIVSETVRLIRSTLPKEVQVTLMLEPGLPSVWGDITQIGQLVLNLVINARDAMGGRPGTISISTRGIDGTGLPPGCLLPVDAGAGPFVCITVSDDGSGMDEDVQARIFDPFFTTKPQGHGLGLASVLGTIRAHRGTLALSSAPGKGTTFWVILPIARTPAQAAAKA